MNPVESIYEALPGPRYIRVLVLKPAMAASDPLIAELDILDLGPALPPIPQRERTPEGLVSMISFRRLSYNALSYSWAMDDGDASFSRGMTLCDKTKCITQNLAEGLYRIRSRTESRRLWVDAVCINQINVVERNAQVAMMFDIYVLAKRVDIWLGNGAVADADYAFWYLAHCLQANEFHPEKGLHWTGHYATALECFNVYTGNSFRTYGSPQSCTALHHITDTEDDDPYKDRDSVHDFLGALEARASVEPDSESRFLAKLETVVSLMHRRYWSRRWIVQEYAAHGLTVGTRVFHWGPFSANSGLMEKVIVLLDIIASYWDDDRRFVVEFRKHAQTAEHLRAHNILDMDICELLQDYSSTQCADPRDRLYSLLALAQDPNLRADYASSFGEVCHVVAKKLVDAEDYRVLIAASYPSPKPLLALPSWVPDLRCPFLLGPFGGSFTRAGSLQDAVIEENTLSFSATWLGSVFNAQFDSSNHIVTIKPDGLGFVDRSEALTSLELHLGLGGSPELWPAAEDGDALFCLYDVNIAVLWYGTILWLRPMDAACSTYKLMAATDMAWLTTQGLELIDLRPRLANKTKIRLV
ncbi:hypothetical protein LTR95_015455 [Oleoguttula sp. CCFEE 5521]